MAGLVAALASCAARQIGTVAMPPCRQEPMKKTARQ
jgi:hypothetical protein